MKFLPYHISYLSLPSFSPLFSPLVFPRATSFSSSFESFISLPRLSLETALQEKRPEAAVVVRGRSAADVAVSVGAVVEVGVRVEEVA